MQIKTTMRYFLTAVRLTKIKKKKMTSAGGGVVKGELLHCWWESKLVQTLWKTIWRFLKNLQIELPYDPAIPFLGIYPKDRRISHWKSACTSMFIVTLFTIAKTWNQPKCPPYR